jgi:hypothetical protein
VVIFLAQICAGVVYALVFHEIERAFQSAQKQR